jgi:DNA-directed RNA polymerase specialized sigma24 family protein
VKDLQTLTLGKIITPARLSKARDGVGPGEHRVRFDASVDAVIRVGEDYEQNVVQSARPWALLAVALAALAPAEREALVAQYLETLRSGESVILEPQAKKAVDADIARIAGATRKTVRGQVTFKQREVR